MAEHIVQTLADVKSAVADLEQQLAEKKRMANWLSEMAGSTAIYDVAEIDGAGESMPRRPTRGDEFVGDKAITALRKALEMDGGPLDVVALYTILVDGGYRFETKTEMNSKNSLRVTLSKNSSVFHRLTNGKYGLVKWYGEKVSKKKPTAVQKPESVALDDEEGQAVMDSEFSSDDAAHSGTK